MAEKTVIKTEERKIFGKKVKKLRSEGLIPAVLYGKGVKTIALQVAQKEFGKAYKKAGETTLVEVKFDKEIAPALIHNVQKDPVTGSFLHVDFHQVSLKEKVVASVPIVLVGESPAQKSGVGLVLQTLNELEIESLPTDIPHEIEVDIAKLEEVGQNILVKDLKIDRDKIEVKTEPEEVVVTVQTAEMKEEAAPEVSPEEVEVIEERKEEAPEEEGEEAPAEEATEEKKE